MVARGKGLAYKAINDGKAVKIAEWEKEEDSPGPHRGPTWGEFLTGFLTREKRNFLFLVKHGSLDTPYEMRKLHPNNSQRAAGSKGEWVDEDEAREWIEDNDLDEGNVADLEAFVEGWEKLKELRD